MNNNRGMFDDIEKKTGVNMGEIMQLVQSLQKEDLKDEKTARRVIQQVGAIANKPVSKEKEDKLVQAIQQNNVPTDLSFISQILNNKK